MDPARIREARLEAGLSLAQLARDDVSRTFIHFIETGKSRPSARVLALIARRTGKPVAYFTGEAGSKADTRLSLAAELTRAANQVHEFIDSERLDEVESSSMKLIELTLKQAAAVTRAIRRRAAAKAPLR